MIFVDSNFWIALFNTQDSCHKKAIELYRALPERFRNRKLMVNNLITAETLTVLSQRGGKALALRFYETVSQSGIVEVVYIDVALEGEAMVYFKKIISKNISFADCTIFATVDKYAIRDVLSFDEHLNYKKDYRLINDAKQVS